eukprot:g76371.t1
MEETKMKEDLNKKRREEEEHMGVGNAEKKIKPVVQNQRNNSQVYWCWLERPQLCIYGIYVRTDRESRLKQFTVLAGFRGENAKAERAALEAKRNGARPIAWCTECKAVCEEGTSFKCQDCGHYKRVDQSGPCTLHKFVTHPRRRRAETRAQIHACWTLGIGFLIRSYRKPRVGTALGLIQSSSGNRDRVAAVSLKSETIRLDVHGDMRSSVSERAY